MQDSPFRHYVNIINEAYQKWPDDDTDGVGGRPSWLIKKPQLGGFTPNIDQQFDKIQSGDKLELARFLATAQDPQDTPEEALLRKELREKVHAALNQLSPRHKQALELWMEGNSLAKLGSKLESPVGPERARQILARAMVKLMRTKYIQQIKNMLHHM